MSLLLNALKKAAEQKAENSRKAGSEAESLTETGLTDKTGGENTSASQSTAPDARSENGQNDKTDADELAIVDDAFGVGTFDDDRDPLPTDQDVEHFLGDNTPLAVESGDIGQTNPKNTGFESAYTRHSVSGDPFGRHGLDSNNETVMREPSKNPDLVATVDSDVSEVGREGVSSSGVGPGGLDEGDTSIVQGSTPQPAFGSDNYDRILHKAVSGVDTSSISGSGFGSDVIMTPENAKTMFLNKSTVPRIRAWRIYWVTALSILLVITAWAIFEIRQESSNIDTRLQPLRRDPMPDSNKETPGIASGDSFAGVSDSEVDATILRLLENEDKPDDSSEIVARELDNQDPIPEQASVPGQDVSEKPAPEKPAPEKPEPEKPVSAEIQEAAPAKPETNADVRETAVIESDPEIDSGTGDRIRISRNSKISDKDRWLSEGYAAWQRGDDQTSFAKYDAVLNVEPGNRDALLARAAINTRNGRVAEAIKDYQTMLIANPKDSLAMSSLISVASFSPEQSETRLKLMLRDEPTSHYLNFALGNILGKQNRWHEAQRYYFAALENSPDNPNYAYNLAVSLEHIAKPGEAIAYYEKALENYRHGLAVFDKNLIKARIGTLRRQ